MALLEVGFAKSDITPQEQRQTIYHRSGPMDDAKTPVRDRLFARATAFRSDGEVAIWVASDLLCVDTRLREGVAVKIASKGIPPDHVALCATHTHTAPTIVRFHGATPTPPVYLEFLESQLVRVAMEALASARPARILFGKSTANLSVNRRQIGRMAQINDINTPTGLVDQEVAVAKIETADGKTGVLFNYCAHPLTMSKNTPLISADYPGRAAAHLETECGMVHAQFLQGCAGNANVKVHGDEEQATLVGRRLAEAVLGASRAARPSGTSHLRMVTHTVRLPWGKIHTAEEARALLEKKGKQDRRTADWAEAVCRAHERGSIKPCAEVIVQAMRVGDGVFVALPGEVFLEIGLAIKQRASVENLFVAAYANSCEVGYIPTAAAFSEGGYEVDVAPYYYGLFQLSPDCEKILVDSALKAVQSVL